MVRATFKGVVDTSGRYDIHDSVSRMIGLIWQVVTKLLIYLGSHQFLNLK